MFFFWLALFLIVFVLSFLLAMRSMKGSSPKPKKTKLPEALFLVRNLAIDSQLLAKIHEFLLADQATLSFERLYKGGQYALTLFGPTNLATELPELNLLELEDYLVPKDQTTVSEQGGVKVNADQVFGTQIPAAPGMGQPNFLTNLPLNEDEQLFYQVVLEPIQKKETSDQFKITVRAMVATSQKDQKVNLAKKVLSEVNSRLGLDKEDLQATPNIFEQYRLRVADGKEIFSGEQVLQILGF